MQMGFNVHFLHCPMRDTMIIVEEVNLPYPQCHLCDMLVPWVALKIRHPNTVQCTKGAEQRRSGSGAG